MSKLVKLRESMTLSEAADHLASILNEPVGEKDILRLALDGHLIISVDLVNKANGRLGHMIAPEDVEYEEFLPSETFPGAKLFEGMKSIKAPKAVCIDENRFVQFEGKVQSIDGIWDLMMVGAERLDVEHLYQCITGGPEVTLVNIEGAFVKRGDIVCRLLESFEENEFQSGSMAAEKELRQSIESGEIPFNEIERIWEDHLEAREKYLEKRMSNRENDFYPADGIPKDSVLVVRTEALLEFLNALDGDTSDNRLKPVSTKERQTYLVLIATLCRQANIDPSMRGISSAIAAMTEEFGAPVSDDTIRNILKQIPDAVEARSNS
jgi:hypothetical protein